MYSHLLKKAAIISIILISITYSCNHESCCDKSEVGIIKDFSGLDGCTFMVVLKNGEKLQVLNLDQFDVNIIDGQEILFSYHEAKGIAGICMAGKIVEADCICKN